MQRKRDGLVPIGDALSDLGGPVQALRETPPPARRGFSYRERFTRPGRPGRDRDRPADRLLRRGMNRRRRSFR